MKAIPLLLVAAVIGLIGPAQARSLDAIRSFGALGLCAHPNSLPFASKAGDPPGFQVELFAAEQKACNFKDTTVSRTSTVDGDHGRIETRDIPLSTISTGFKKAINGLASRVSSWSRAPVRPAARSNARRVFT